MAKVKAAGKFLGFIWDVTAGIFGKGKTAKKVRVAKKTVKANKAGLELAKETGKGLKEAGEALKVSKETLKGLRKTGKVRAIKTGRALLLGGALLVGGKALTSDDEQGKTERVEITSDSQGMKAAPKTEVKTSKHVVDENRAEKYGNAAKRVDVKSARLAACQAMKEGGEIRTNLVNILYHLNKTGVAEIGPKERDEISSAGQKEAFGIFMNTLGGKTVIEDGVEKSFMDSNFGKRLLPDGKDTPYEDVIGNWNRVIEENAKAAESDQARKAPAVNKTVADAMVPEKHQLPNGQTIALSQAKGRGGMGA